MIPKLLEKWLSYCTPGLVYHTLGFKTKSAAKRFLRAKGATPVESEYLPKGWYRYADGRDARLFKFGVNHEYPWMIHEVQLGDNSANMDLEKQE